MKGKEVPFPDFLDQFGESLTQEIKLLEVDALKPALVSDIVKCMERIFILQQVNVTAYLSAVKNHEVMGQAISNLAKDINDLKTKLAKG